MCLLLRRPALTLLRLQASTKVRRTRASGPTVVPADFVQTEKGTKGRKRKEGSKELSKDDETIKRLKVGLTRRRSICTEFKDLDKPSDQIRRLRQILTDLGMKGRMSMEQAKAIREKREFQQELGASRILCLARTDHSLCVRYTEDVKEFAQKMESANRRRSAKAASAEEEELDESDVELPPKRRVRPYDAPVRISY